MGDPSKTDTYFALLTGKDLGDAIFDRKNQYQRFLQDSGLLSLYQAMHWRYYGQDSRSNVTDKAIILTGEKGEIHNLNVNHMRSDVSLWLTLASAQRNEFEPQTTQDSYEGELEAKYAKTLLEHWRNKIEMEAVEVQSIEFAGLFGIGYRLMLWNKLKGDPIAQQEQALPELVEDGMEPVAPPPQQKAGALEAWALHPLDVFVDPFQNAPRNLWAIARTWRNRWDIIADYPEHEEAIRNIKMADKEVDSSILRSFGTFATMKQMFPSANVDDIPVYHFVHEPSSAVPQGLVVTLLGADLILSQEPMLPTYERSPLRRLACAEWHESPFGYTPAFGLLAPAEAAQSLGTIGLTNARTFGLGVLIAPKGSDIEDTAITDGLTLIEYPAGLNPPTSLQMPSTPQEVYMLRDTLIRESALLLGLNSVVKGDPEASLKSGSALALVQATATQAVQQLASNIVRCNEGSALDTIRISAQNMTVETRIEAAGPELSPLLNFVGGMVKNIKRVKALTINPLAKNLAGRVQIADTLLEKFPNQLELGDYFRLMETGNLDQILRPKAQKSRNLDRENEMLSSGRMPVPFLTDDHRAHVRKHLEVLDNPLLRESEDPKARAIVESVDQHIAAHVDLAIQGMQNLPLLELAGILPLESLMAMVPPPSGVPGEGTPPQGPQASPQGDSVSQPVPPEASQQPRMPEMPVNPATGERAEPPGPP